MNPSKSIPVSTRAAHARKDFVDRGVKYLIGEVYPRPPDSLDSLEVEKVRRLHAARYIDYGLPDERRAASAARRRAEMAKPGKPAPPANARGA